MSTPHWSTYDPEQLVEFAENRFGLIISDATSHEWPHNETNRTQILAYIQKVYIDDATYEDFMKEARFLLSRRSIDSGIKSAINAFLYTLEQGGTSSYLETYILENFAVFLVMGSQFPKNIKRWNFTVAKE